MFYKLFKAVGILFIAICVLVGGVLPPSTVHAYACGTGDGDCMVVMGSPEVLGQVISLTSVPFEQIATADPFNLNPVGTNADGSTVNFANESEVKAALLNNQADIAISTSACQAGVDDAGATMFSCSQIVDTIFARKNGQSWHLLTEPVSSKSLVGLYASWLLSPAGQTIVKNAGYENVMPTVPNGGVSYIPGKLAAWGNNDFGQGVIPAEIAGEKSFIAVASGSSHNLALTQGGDIYAWGDNSQGQLGTSLGWIATDAAGGQFGNISAIAAGSNHSLALMDAQGSTLVFAWGNNSAGQLGDGSMTNRSQPVQVTVPGLANVKAIAAGDNFSLALTFDGKLFSWGSNPVPAALQDETFTAIAASGMVSAALRANGTVVAWGDQGDAPAWVNSGARVIAIAAGRTHFVALKEDGTVAVWGEDLGAAPAGLSGVTAVATGELNGLALKSNGTLVEWDPYGGSTDPGVKGVTAIAMGGYHSLAIVSAPTWDVLGDHIIDISDVVAVGLKWGQTGAKGWIPEDVNFDGIIDISDVVEIGIHWTQTW